MNVLLAFNPKDTEWSPPRQEMLRLIKKFPDVNFNTTLEDADVVLGWMIDGSALKTAKNLKWFHTPGVQYGRLFPQDIYERAVVTNSKGVWAEYITGQFFKMLAQRKLKGLTALVIGPGGIGSRVISMARKRHMMVLVSKNAPDDLYDKLGVADIVFITAPHTKMTENMINEKTIGLMKKGVVILSSSRPELIDANALKKALSEGRIASAVIDDLWPKELQRLNNVKVFPHSTPKRYNIWPEVFRIFETNLRLFMKGKTLKNRIHPCERSY